MPPSLHTNGAGHTSAADEGEYDVQMMSDSVVLPASGRPVAAAAAREQEAGNDGMAVDSDGSQSGASSRRPSAKLATNGFGSRHSNGEAATNSFGYGDSEANGPETSTSRNRPLGIRLNPSLQINGKSPGGGGFASVNSLYAGVLSTAELDAVEQRGRGSLPTTSLHRSPADRLALSLCDSFRLLRLDSNSNRDTPGQYSACNRTHQQFLPGLLYAARGRAGARRGRIVHVVPLRQASPDSDCHSSDLQLFPRSVCASIRA